MKYIDNDGNIRECSPILIGLARLIRDVKFFWMHFPLAWKRLKILRSEDKYIMYCEKGRECGRKNQLGEMHKYEVLAGAQLQHTLELKKKYSTLLRLEINYNGTYYETVWPKAMSNSDYHRFRHYDDE